MTDPTGTPIPTPAPLPIATWLPEPPLGAYWIVDVAARVLLVAAWTLMAARVSGPSLAVIGGRVVEVTAWLIHVAAGVVVVAA